MFIAATFTLLLIYAAIIGGAAYGLSGLTDDTTVETAIWIVAGGFYAWCALVTIGATVIAIRDDR